MGLIRDLYYLSGADPVQFGQKSTIPEQINHCYRPYWYRYTCITDSYSPVPDPDSIGSDQHRLVDHLFTGYKNEVRPMCYSAGPLEVRVGLAMRQIIEMVRGFRFFCILLFCLPLKLDYSV